MQNRFNIKTIKDTDAFDGRWYKHDDGFARITILRDLMFITSRISTKPRKLNLDLPGHPPFYVSIEGTHSVRTVLVGENEPIKANVSRGEQIRGMVALQ